MRADLYGWNDQFESEYTMHMATEPDSGNRRMLEIWITTPTGGCGGRSHPDIG